MQTPAELFDQAQALLAAGRFGEAATRLRDLIAAAPQSHQAESHLARLLDDRRRFADAEQHWRAALAKGAQDGAAHLALARNLRSQKRYDEAEKWLREAAGRNAVAVNALFELAELLWQRTGDAPTALAPVERALAAAPADTALRVVKAAALHNIGQAEEALALARAIAADHPGNPSIAVMLAQSAIHGGAPDALPLAERALALAPRLGQAQRLVAEAALAAGDAQRASAIAERLRAEAPQDQYLTALQATAWRILGDARYRGLYDYDALISVAPLTPPPGWRDLPTYLDDLASVLTSAHAYDTHPFGQSIRHGGQTSDILEIDHPAIRALPSALDPPIRAHLAKLGRGADPVRARNTGAYAFQGMWSIRMRAGGFHLDHIHDQGWLSSACYLRLPDMSRGREGWLRFGKPGLATAPPLAAEHYVQPARGLLALFPSYMWHGTEPFTDDGVRLTFAFDLIPS